MSEIQSVTLAMIGAGSLLAYMGFRLNESESEALKVLGTFFFTVSLAFVLGLTWVASQVAENTAPYDQWLAPGITPYLTALTWMFIITVLLLFFRTAYGGLKVLMSYLEEISLIKRKSETKRGGRVR